MRVKFSQFIVPQLKISTLRKIKYGIKIHVLQEKKNVKKNPLKL